MNIAVVIVLLSMFIWLFPPIKQYKTKFFLFFLFYALADPIAISSVYFFKISGQRFYPIFLFLVLFSLFEKTKVKTVGVIIIAIVFFYLSQFLSQDQLIIVDIIIHFFILLMISYMFTKHIIDEGSVNLFLILLITYELIALLKNFAVIVDFQQGLYQFYVSTLIQIIFGISFIFININTKSFQILQRETTT